MSLIAVLYEIQHILSVAAVLHVVLRALPPSATLLKLTGVRAVLVAIVLLLTQWLRVFLLN